MTRQPWLVRPARRTDRSRLAAFRCATGRERWQIEVERFIQDDLLDWRFAPGAVGGDPRLLLVFDRAGDELVGVAAHERVVMKGASGRPYPATKLEVLAVASDWQGKRFSTGERVSDVVMSTVMVDVSRRRPPRDARVFAVVHRDNTRSLALCIRHGLTKHLSSPDPDYQRLVTPHR